MFNQGVVDAEEILHSAQMYAWLCLKHGPCAFSYSFTDWILNPGLCLKN